MSRTFRVSAVNSEGNESELSDPVGIVVTPSNEVSEWCPSPSVNFYAQWKNNRGWICGSI